MTQQYDWQTALTSSYDQLFSYLIGHVPHLIGAIFLVILGWLIAFLLSKLTLVAMRFVARLWDGTASNFGSANVAEFKSSHSLVISKVVFWIVMLFFIAAAASSLGMNFFASWLSAFLAYVPQLLAGLVILIGGYLLANIAGAMAHSAAESAEFSQPNLIGTCTKIAILFTSLVIGVEQLGINIQFITTLFIVVSGILLFGIALGFGLGSKTLIANVISTKQIRKHLKLNEHIRIGEVEGRLVDITSTMLVIETEHGREFIPSQGCMQWGSHLVITHGDDSIKNKSANATDKKADQ